MGLQGPGAACGRASHRPPAPTLVASPDVSSEAAPPVATPPGDPDAELITALLAELDVSDGPLATFAKSYAHRVRLDRLEPLDPVELAAQVRGLYGFVDARRGDVGVRAINPTVDRDGYRTPGTVVEANTADAPFLIDSVSEALRGRGLEVRHVVHPVMGVERTDEGSVRSVGPARGALHRESMMHFEVDRRVPDDQLDDLAQAVTRVLARRAAVRARLPCDGRSHRPHGRVRAGRRHPLPQGRGQRGRGAAALAARRQLRVPRIPRVRDRRRG